MNGRIRTATVTRCSSPEDIDLLTGDVKESLEARLETDHGVLCLDLDASGDN
jgi:hypothetical protein